ncbi:NAD(P)-binding protein [Marasmius fiardii PR-910]|nr:NAD(P)-binding protein [Marasmius fiardii PR-910]
MSISKQTVFLVGATGKTGSSIARALAAEPENFNLIALIRPSTLENSLPNPIISELKKSRNVQIIPGDIVDDTEETLQEHLKSNDVDVLILTTVPFQPGQQNKILLAAKKAGVKRVVPSDFGPWAPKGAMAYQDGKLLTQEFIKAHEIPYTFIYIGVWTHQLFPAPHSASVNNHPQTVFYGSGDLKTAYTTLERVGEFVKRIITDERTLNRTVMTYDGECTLGEAWKVGEEVSGEKFGDYTRLTGQEIESKVSEDPTNKVIYEYVRAFFVRGDNTVENAVKDGEALDATELYPDYVPLGLEECAKEFYRGFSDPVDENSK